MKNYKIWIAIVIALLVVNSAALVVMWLHRGGHRITLNRFAGQEPKDVLISALALTPKQQDLYTVMRIKHRQATVKLNEANHGLRDSLFAYIKKPNADTVLVNALTRKIANNQVLMEKATLYHFREFRAILTVEQQSKFDGIINDVLRMMATQGHMPGIPGRNGPPNGMPPPGADRMGPPDGPSPGDVNPNEPPPGN